MTPSDPPLWACYLASALLLWFALGWSALTYRTILIVRDDWDDFDTWEKSARVWALGVQVASNVFLWGTAWSVCPLSWQ